jgi:hypothetical protein
MVSTGKLIVFIGIAVVIIGLVVWLFGNKFTWFGHLPGDIRIEKENFKFYAPLASMLLVSAFITILLWIIRKLF